MTDENTNPQDMNEDQIEASEQGGEASEVENLAKLLNIKILVQKTEDDAPQFGGVVRFHSEGVKLDNNAPKVCLSRKKPESGMTGCWFAIDNLQAHDGHVPAWHDEAQMDAYIQRVMTDVQEVVESYQGSVLDKPFDPSMLDGFGEEDKSGPFSLAGLPSVEPAGMAPAGGLGSGSDAPAPNIGPTIDPNAPAPNIGETVDPNAPAKNLPYIPKPTVHDSPVSVIPMTEYSTLNDSEFSMDDDIDDLDDEPEEDHEKVWDYEG